MKDGKSKSQRTKEAIADSYRRLLKVKPASKITVSDIVKGCGMTVPTFYNHFEDKYSLIVWIYASDGASIMSHIGKDGYVWKDTLLDAMRYFSRNRDFVLIALTHSEGRSQFMNVVEETNIGLLNKEVRKKLKTGEDIPKDIAELVRLYCMGTVRYIYDWLISGSPIPPEEVSFIMEDALPYKLRYYLM